MISKEGIVEYFGSQPNGVHRQNTEVFFEAEAREKIFHIGEAHSLLDFGCGTGDLLAYYARRYPVVTGVDIVPGSVERARKRLEAFGFPHAQVLCADERTVWDALGSAKFDVITATAVMQYFDEAQFRTFLGRAKDHLTPVGRVAIFDAIDPRLYWLFKFGWFRQEPYGLAYAGRALIQSAKVLARKARSAVTRQTEDHMGRSHHPLLVEHLARQEGFSTAIACSMYYEYRYHALLQPER